MPGTTTRLSAESAGASYRIWQDASSVKVYEAINNASSERASFG
jgi:hypothetical protein